MFGSCGRISNVIGVLSLMLGLANAGCAARSRGPIEFQRLVIENASPDVIRVYIDLGDREVLLGRVDPMSTEVFRVRPGTLPLSAGGARMVVVPVGTAAAIQLPSKSAAGIRSDPYRLNDLMLHVWRFSGSQVQPIGLRM